jgi:hypothetical protein
MPNEIGAAAEVLEEPCPWDDAFDRDNDDAFEAFWKTQTGSDFYFAIYKPNSDYDVTEGAGATALISPKAYVDRDGCLWDGGMNLEHIFGEHFHELMESTYEFDGPPDRARELLLSFGMTENHHLGEDDSELDV